MYEKELLALKRADRFRQRVVYDKVLKDFASNDYLGFAEKKSFLKKAYKELKKFPSNAAKASLLVNGYTQIHKNFEEDLCRVNGFEKGVVLGSGFLANIAMIEALPRRGDLLLIDEEYHASGVLATRLSIGKVEFFRHNNAEDLNKKIKSSSAKRVFIAVEGVYSMSGDLLNEEIFHIADENEALLIVDEAHSSGVIGQKLMGIFDYYKIWPKSNHIKMGTLGKAYGSYGAYILASKEVISFLENRAKSIIYTTALSLFDVLLAHEALKYIEKKSKKLSKRIEERKDIIKSVLNKDIESLILPIEFKSSNDVLMAQKSLLQKGFFFVAIRPPTVKQPILRVIPRLKESKKSFYRLLKEIESLQKEFRSK